MGNYPISPRHPHSPPPEAGGDGIQPTAPGMGRDPYGPAAGQTDLSSEIYQYIRVIYGRRWLILAAAILGVAYSAFNTFREPRRYTAQATIEFKQAVPPGQTLDIAQQTLFLPPEMATRLLTTKMLAARVINNQRSRGDDWFGPSAGPPPSSPSLLQMARATVRNVMSWGVSMARSFLAPPPRRREIEGSVAGSQDLEGVDKGTIQQYYGHVGVRPVRGTALVDVVVTHTDPAVAAQVANDHAHAFVEMDLENKVESLSEARGVFGQQLDEVREKLEASRRALSDYQIEHGIPNLPDDSTTLSHQSLEQLNSLLTKAEANRIAAEAAFRNASAASLDRLAMTYPDSGLQGIRDEMLRLEARYTALSQEYGERHPDMIQMQARIESMHEQLRRAAAQLRNRLEAAFEAARTKEAELRKSLEEVGRRASEEDRQLVQLLVLQRDVSSNEQLYSNLLQESNQTDIMSRTFHWTNARVVDQAVIPTVPSYPQTRSDLMFGLLFGLGAGVLLSILLDRLDTSIHTPEDVENGLQLPTLGVVPDFQLLADRAPYSRNGMPRDESLPQATSSEQRQIVLLKHPSSVVSEAYRGLRTNLMFSSPGHPPRRVLLTSSQAQEGKTVSSVNLAVTLALSGSRVVVVDADLRRPGCHTALRVDREPGLSNILSGQSELADAIVRSPLSPRMANTENDFGVYVLPAGHLPPNPAELLGSSEMDRVLDRLSEEFDFVILDSPPILPVTDSVVLSTKADAVLLVVREGVWGRDVIRKALASLDRVHARTLGAVLNCVNTRRGGSSSYYYRYYYGYGSRYYRSAAEEAPRDSV